MKWFKHMVCSGDDEKLSAVIDELGMEGYGFYWRLLEIVAEKLDASGNTSCQYSAKKWGNFFQFSAKKFLKFSENLAKKRLIFMEISENFVKIDIPNLLKYRDNYQKNLQAANKNVSPRLKIKEEELNTPLSPTEICPPAGGSSPSPKNKKSPARFQQPTPEEVQAYCDERGNGISGQAFVDYYAAQGWKLANGRPLKDWQAAVRTWERHEDGRRQAAATVPRATTVAQQRSLERQYMAQMLLDDREQQKLEEARNAQGNRLIANSDGAQSSFPPGW